MKLPIQSLLLATTFGMTCGAHAAGLSGAAQSSALETYVSQAHQDQVAAHMRHRHRHRSRSRSRKRDQSI